MRKSDCGFEALGWHQCPTHSTRERKFFFKVACKLMLDEFGGKIQRIQILSFLPTHPPTPKIFSMSLQRSWAVVKMRPKALLCFLSLFPLLASYTHANSQVFEEYYLHPNSTTNNDSIMGVFKECLEPVYVFQQNQQSC